MNWEEYIALFDAILKGENTDGLYGDPDHVHYTKLNQSRMKRWLKKGELTEELKKAINTIQEKQKWVLITEPWCGDAAHIAPFVYLASTLNTNIELVIEARDGSDSEIDHYLTNGGKAVPKLIVRSEKGEDLFVWGPRPVNAINRFAVIKQEVSDVNEQKAKLQEWYNSDEGKSLQTEIMEGLLAVPVRH